MSFRYELKVRLLVSDRIAVINKLLRNGMTRLYPDRLIKSTYFDSHQRSSFHDSAEGCTPRKKIRLRSYVNNAQFLLENKISSVEGRFKQSTLILRQQSDRLFSFGIFDSWYGHCSPLVTVVYQRSYFQLNGWRLTVDQKIKYSKYGSVATTLDNENVLEFKAPRELTFAPESILEKLGLVQSRFSKYERAIISQGLDK